MSAPQRQQSPTPFEDYLARLNAVLIGDVIRNGEYEKLQRECKGFDITPADVHGLVLSFEQHIPKGGIRYHAIDGHITDLDSTRGAEMLILELTRCVLAFLTNFEEPGGSWDVALYYEGATHPGISDRIRSVILTVMAFICSGQVFWPYFGTLTDDVHTNAVLLVLNNECQFANFTLKDSQNFQLNLNIFRKVYAQFFEYVFYRGRQARYLRWGHDHITENPYRSEVVRGDSIMKLEYSVKEKVAFTSSNSEYQNKCNEWARGLLSRKEPTQEGNNLDLVEVSGNNLNSSFPPVEFNLPVDLGEDILVTLRRLFERATRVKHSMEEEAKATNKTLLEQAVERFRTTERYKDFRRGINILESKIRRMASQRTSNQLTNSSSKKRKQDHTHHDSTNVNKDPSVVSHRLGPATPSQVMQPPVHSASNTMPTASGQQSLPENKGIAVDSQASVQGSSNAPGPDASTMNQDPSPQEKLT